MTSLENTAFLSQCFVKNLEASARALVLQFTSAVTVLAQERAHPLGTGHTEFDLQHAENNVSNNTSLLSVRSLLVRVRDDMQCLLDRLSTENATHFSDDTLEKVIDSDKRTHERDVFTDKQFCDIEGSSEGSFGTVSAARQHATSSETQQKRILSPVKNWFENSSLVQAHDICPIHVSAFCGVSPKAENTPSCSFDLFECAMDQKQELFEIRQRLDVAVRRIELLEAINLSTCSNASASLQRHQRDCNPANLVKIGSDQHSEERRTAVDASLMGSGPRTALAPTGRGGRSCTRAPVEAWQGAAASPCTLAPVGAQGGSAPRGEQCGDAAEGRASVDRFAARVCGSPAPPRYEAHISSSPSTRAPSGWFASSPPGFGPSRARLRSPSEQHDESNCCIGSVRECEEATPRGGGEAAPSPSGSPEVCEAVKKQIDAINRKAARLGARPQTPGGVRALRRDLADEMQVFCKQSLSSGRPVVAARRGPGKENRRGASAKLGESLQGALARSSRPRSSRRS
uniref:Uncharacterized protein n=1 Tax=Tetraselmis sp. GSL018 TaxID=582737 RepID=A0A061SCP8_9CHLO|mmetsp:Transcript_11126/g.26404  ORF Transcript_11126/g.26404 Transcript_11126/m.26404 type:complete len:515 (-) Transcript_11126:136-1680(-)